MYSKLAYCLEICAYLALVTMVILTACYIAWPYEFEVGKNYYSDPNWATVIGYLLTGILSCLSLLSLSRIVQACDKIIMDGNNNPNIKNHIKN